MNAESKIVEDDDDDEMLEEESSDFDNDIYSDDYSTEDATIYDALLYDNEEEEGLLEDEDEYFGEDDDDATLESSLTLSQSKRKMKILQSWIASQLPIAIKPYNALVDNTKNISSKMLMILPPTPTASKEQTQPPITSTESNKPPQKQAVTAALKPLEEESVHCSSGYWNTIDQITSFGLSSTNPEYRISKKLYSIRKKAASVTGLHGVLSQKKTPVDTKQNLEIEEEKLGIIKRKLLVIERARERIKESIASNEQLLKTQSSSSQRKNKKNKWRILLSQSIQSAANLRKEILLDTTTPSTLDSSDDNYDYEYESGSNPTQYSNSNVRNTSTNRKKLPPENKLSPEETIKQKQRIQEINILIENNQVEIQQLQTEKEYLTHTYNPLYNYTSTTSTSTKTTNDNTNSSKEEVREFDYPSKEIVDDYIEELMNNGRLTRMNHTYLWRETTATTEDDNPTNHNKDRSNSLENEPPSSNPQNNAAVTSWILRQTILGSGSKTTIGEKISDIVEDQTYKAVCSSLMSILTKAISSLHGLNIMTHADICLHVVQQSKKKTTSQISDKKEYHPNLEEEDDTPTIKRKKKKKKRKKPRKMNKNPKEALLIETFLSHVQIAAPIFKLFPLKWQRAFIGNLITLVIAIIEDFSQGITLYILGYELRIKFQPKQENGDDGFLLDQFFSSTTAPFQRCTSHAVDGSTPTIPTSSLFSKEEFEVITQRIANDLSDKLQFLDKWHERVLGGQILRTQIGMVISRIVLLIMEDVLRSIDIDLWDGKSKIGASLSYLL